MLKKLTGRRAKTGLLLFLSLMTVWAVAGCGQASKAGEQSSATKEKITVVLDWTPNTNHTGLYVALAKGYYEEAGLDVEIVQPPEGGALALVASGKAQFGVGFQESLGAALTADAPLPVKAVAAIVAHNTSGIISLKTKGIDSFEKLAGKKYATWGLPVEQAMIDAVMKSKGSSFAEVEAIPTMVTDVVSAIQTNIDAVWVYEGWDYMAVQLAGLDFNFIKFGDVLPVLDFCTPVLVSSDAFLAEKPEVAKKFMAATAQGYEFAIANPDEAATILLTAVPELDEKMVKASQSFLAEAYQAEQADWGVIDEQRWSNFYQWLYEEGLIPTALDNQGFTNGFLPGQ